MTSQVRRHFPTLEADPGARAAPEPRRVAIASVDIAGPYQAGGVGTAYHGLALALAEAGHRVTILYLSHRFDRGTAGEWEAYFGGHGIEFVHHPQPVPGHVWYGRRPEASFACYQWLKANQRFDVIHFHEWLGLSYYSVLAKRQGLAFEGCTLCVGTHGPMRWSREGDQVLLSRSEDLVVDFMERQSVARADLVVSPSRYLLEWMEDDGWTLPERAFVQQNVVDAASIAPAPLAPKPIRELVFFGRLDRRKGLPFFCDVVEQLEADNTPEFSVALLGANAMIDRQTSLDYLRHRTRRWRQPPRVLTGEGREEALAYLRDPGRLAVMPSSVDNSPCTVLECIQRGIPFLVSDVGGIPELIHAEDRPAVTSPLRAERFAGRIRDILAAGQRRARPAVDPQETRRGWVGWHARIEGAPSPGVERPLAQAPLVSICIAHYERPRLLKHMLASIRRQTYPHVEVVVVDDGSQGPDALGYLEELREELVGGKGCVLRQENRGPGAARNRAANQARGSLLLFLDDDDYLEPQAVRTFVDVASRTSADALVCVYKQFAGDGVPDGSTPVRRWLVPLGPALVAGLIYPQLGGTIYMITREAFKRTGGFREERDVDEDWEFLIEVVRSDLDLQVIPEPLLWYREQTQSRSRVDNRVVRAQSRIRLFEKMLPVELRDLVGLAHAYLFSAVDAQPRLERVREVLAKNLTPEQETRLRQLLVAGPRSPRVGPHPMRPRSPSDRAVP